MGWAFDYLNGIKREDVNKTCPERKGGKSHKAEFWFGELYCKHCNAKLEYKKDKNGKMDD